MSFEVQLVVSVIVGSTIGIPIYRIKKKQYKKQGKSTKYLLYKIYITILIPIMLIPILLSDLTPLSKLFVILLLLLVGILDINDSISFRKSIRNTLGFPHEDDELNEVIKEDGQTKSENEVRRKINTKDNSQER